MKKIISLMIMLALIMSMGMSAFAVELPDNPEGAEIDIIDSGDYMGKNYGTVVENHGTVVENHGAVGENYGLVYHNLGTIENKSRVDGESDIITGRVDVNHGHVTGGIVEKNGVYGTVSEGTTVIEQYYAMFIDSELAQMNDDFELSLVKYNTSDDSSTPASAGYFSHNGEYYFELEPTEHYHIICQEALTVSPAGNCSFVDNGDGTYMLDNVSGNFTLSIAKSSVPDTGDVSNMPLWGALLLMFAATALLTRKKKA